MRRLPHAHILLFLYLDDKHRTPSRIDEIIMVEIIDKNIDPKGTDVIKNFMMHGPCSGYKKDAPCMLKDKCTKHFPKKFYN